MLYNLQFTDKARVKTDVMFVVVMIINVTFLFQTTTYTYSQEDDDDDRLFSNELEMRAQSNIFLALMDDTGNTVPENENPNPYQALEHQRKEDLDAKEVLYNSSNNSIFYNCTTNIFITCT